MPLYPWQHRGAAAREQLKIGATAAHICATAFIAPWNLGLADQRLPDFETGQSERLESLDQRSPRRRLHDQHRRHAGQDGASRQEKEVSPGNRETLRWRVEYA